MARVTAILNQKGGVGKTTTAHALISALTLTDHNVLAIDADAQSDLTHTMRGEAEAPGIYEAMQSGTAPNIQRLKDGDLLGANFDLFYADRYFLGRYGYNSMQEVIETIPARYDHIIIDCPPNLGVMVENALQTATDIVVPVQPAEYAAKGLAQLFRIVEQVRKKDNPDLKISGILFTLAHKRATVHQKYMEDIREYAKENGIKVYEPVIYSAIAIQEAQYNSDSVYSDAPRAAVSQAYMEFTRDYLLQEMKNNGN